MTQLSRINAIALPCGPCEEQDIFGAKHILKPQPGGKLVLRCRGCGGGYIVNLRDLPRDGPPELFIQAITNLVVNRMVEKVLDPNPRMTDPEAPEYPE
jgi:hypothetical protein